MAVKLTPLYMITDTRYISRFRVRGDECQVA